jgi:hypothetical protein
MGETMLAPLFTMLLVLSPLLLPLTISGCHAFTFRRRSAA